MDFARRYALMNVWPFPVDEFFARFGGCEDYYNYLFNCDEPEGAVYCGSCGQWFPFFLVGIRDHYRDNSHPDLAKLLVRDVATGHVSLSKAADFLELSRLSIFIGMQSQVPRDHPFPDYVCLPQDHLNSLGADLSEAVQNLDGISLDLWAAGVTMPWNYAPKGN